VSTFSILLRQRIRRDRVTVTIWVASTGFLALVSAYGVAREYGTDADRSGILHLAVANPAILLLRGLPQGAGLDQFIFFQIFTYLALMAALMSTFLAVRHSRAEEESGRAELIASTPAARLIPTTATIVHGVLANLALAVLVALGFMGAGVEPLGSLLTGAAAAGTGVAFLGIGLLAAQFFRSPRAANSVSVALVLASFVLRGIGDALGTPSTDGLHMTSAWPSWLSPIGWGQHVDAFGANTLAPLLLQLGLAAIAIGAVYALQSNRDSGASLVAERPGRAQGGAALNGTLGLAMRLQLPSIIGWCIGGAACGLFAGSLSPLLRSAAETTPAIATSLSAIAGAGTSLDQALLTVMFSIAGVLASASAVQAVVRLRQEESDGTAELLLAAPVSRVRWFFDYLVVGGVAIAAVLLAGAVVAASAVAATSSGSELIADALGAAAAQLPAALVFLGVLALVFTLFPAITAALGWSILGLTFFIGVFGPLLGLPDTITKLSPFANTPVPFGDDTDWSGGIWMLAVAAVAIAASLILMRGRALRST
jgi:ABC-2 type transport system permease protein